MNWSIAKRRHFHYRPGRRAPERMRVQEHVEVEAEVEAKPAAQGAAEPHAEKGLGVIWYVLPGLWMLIAVSGHVILSYWPELLADPVLATYVLPA